MEHVFFLRAGFIYKSSSCAFASCLAANVSSAAAQTTKSVAVQKLFLRNATTEAKEFWQARPNYTQEVEVIMRQLFLTNTR